jgi:ligand-binding SRPBCC domain-containing protein
MKVRNFETEVWLPRPREEVFAFFSEVANLDAITPPWVKFKTITPGPIEIRVGTVIDHRLRIHGIPIRWRSKITAWEPPTRFVDEQVRGPYRVWAHEHLFEERDGGTVVRDRVRFAAPFAFFTHKFLVQPDVERIFRYRTECLKRRFAPG